MANGLVVSIVFSVLLLLSALTTWVDDASWRAQLELREQEKFLGEDEGSYGQDFHAYHHPDDTVSYARAFLFAFHCLPGPLLTPPSADPIRLDRCPSPAPSYSFGARPSNPLM